MALQISNQILFEELFGDALRMIILFWQLKHNKFFYVNDLKFGSHWKVVEKSQHRHIWDLLEIEENGEADINNVKTPIHIVVEDVNLETQ